MAGRIDLHVSRIEPTNANAFNRVAAWVFPQRAYATA